MTRRTVEGLELDGLGVAAQQVHRQLQVVRVVDVPLRTS
jgi:hypothetical protein